MATTRTLRTSIKGVRHARAASAVATVATGCLVLVAAGLPATASARTMKVSENVSMRLVTKSGSMFTHRGTATGTVAGSTSSRMTLTSLSLSGVVTIRTKDGSVNMKVRGTARSSGLRSTFDGTATMAGGTGRYRKARGTGRFSGVVNRSTWAATIKATGSLTY